MNLTELYSKADYQDEMGMLFHDDCMNLLKEIDDNCVDLVLTDPPYLCDYSRHDSKSRFSKKIANDENNSANEGMIERYLQECFRIMKVTRIFTVSAITRKSTFSNSRLKRRDSTSKT